MDPAHVPYAHYGLMRTPKPKGKCLDHKSVKFKILFALAVGDSTMIFLKMHLSGLREKSILFLNNVIH